MWYNVDLGSCGFETTDFRVCLLNGQSLSSTYKRHSVGTNGWIKCRTKLNSKCVLSLTEGKSPRTSQTHIPQRVLSSPSHQCVFLCVCDCHLDERPKYFKDPLLLKRFMLSKKDEKILNLIKVTLPHLRGSTMSGSTLL